jgi:hypothetical protein
MYSHKLLSRRLVLGRSLIAILAGCGGPPEMKPIDSDERGLRELAEIYRAFASKSKRAPRSLKELNVKGQQNPIAVSMIKSGDLIVQWGASLSPEGDTASAILAYVKTVPEQGGYVLMQDGRTIKKMAADEFRSAPKASPR